MSCNCSTPMVGGSRKRYQVGKNRRHSSRRSKSGGGWFSSWFGNGNSDENKEETNVTSSVFGGQEVKPQTPSVSSNMPMQIAGSKKRHRRGGKHCKTSQYKFGGRRHSRNRTHRRRK